MHEADARKNKQRSLLFLACATMISPVAGHTAPDECADWVAKAISTEGSVERHTGMDTAWQPVKPNQVFCPGSAIRTGPRSRAALLLRNQSVLRIDQRSAIIFPAAESETPFWLRMLNGAVNVITRTPKKFQIDTPFVNAAVDGTEFLVTATENEAAISVFEGQVSATNPQGQRILKGGESASAGPGQAPVPRILVRPRDAVQWTLYYPPLLTFRREDFREGNENAWQGRVRRSIAAYRENLLSDALELVAQTPQDTPGTSFFTWRAALLLETGRSDEAISDLQTALGLDPNHGPAHAQQAIIAVTQNRRDEALEQARRATTLTPHSATAWIALSYAEQASFNLQAALDASRQAVEKEPGNALAWARLAELQLSLADLDSALAAAEKAAMLDPNLARTHSVLGFARLAQINTRAARLSFEHAIALASSDPLPRLGLGLAKIRDGELAPGREDIEIATALDPNNALVRSYMGKTYYEEKREKLAASQFDIAKTLEPNDPTPWFYDAILKQSVNRPVEALRDLQKSIELNDNRVVYRSRLLLDSDAAARSASQARVYSDLGFQQLALVEGWKSLNTDPANHSAHRFLADSYAALPRHEIARVSELLQAQLLQPLNINPIQPQLAESNLGILDGAGPSRAGMSEFNPLFARDRIGLQLNGIGGGNNTLGNDLVVSGAQGKLSYSIGQFHYQTDGFRKNNDIKQDIYALFVQGALSHKTSIQAEFRSSDRENGDVALRFSQDNFSAALRENTNTETSRLGFRHAFSPSSDLIGSVIFQNSDSDGYDANPFLSITSARKDQGYIGEIQHLFRSMRFNLVSGIGHYSLDRKTVITTDFGIPFIPKATSSKTGDTERGNAYFYSRTNLLENMTFALGMSADKYQGTFMDKNQINPKLGLIWNISPTTTFRAAAFRVLKRDLITNQTLEPTQVAGFNQFFDDLNGTDSKRHGIALDKWITHSAYSGIELSRRDMSVPYNNPFSGETLTAKWKENIGRFYLYWSPQPWLSSSVEYNFERIERDANFTTENLLGLKTHKLPLAINLFSPSGLTIQFKATYFNQAGDFLYPASSLVTHGSNQFWLANFNASYRLPKRYGIISAGVNNLFNKRFSFQDTDPATPRVSPQRLIFLKFTLAF